MFPQDILLGKYTLLGNICLGGKLSIRSRCSESTCHPHKECMNRRPKKNYQQYKLCIRRQLMRKYQGRKCISRQPKRQNQWGKGCIR